MSPSSPLHPSPRVLVQIQTAHFRGGIRHYLELSFPLPESTAKEGYVSSTALPLLAERQPL